RLPLRLLELRLDFLRDLGQLREDFDRLLWILRLLESRACLLEPVEQVLGALEPVLGRHALVSCTIFPSMPFTRRPASSEEQRLASVTASSIATSTGTASSSSSTIASRRMFRSSAPRRSAVHSSAASVIRRSSSSWRS